VTASINNACRLFFSICCNNFSFRCGIESDWYTGFAVTEATRFHVGKVLLLLDSAKVDIARLLPIILAGYALPLDGYHGVAHWARVLENGLRIAAETGANVEVVSLFAVLHDARRINEGADPLHGSRGAALAVDMRGRDFDLDDREFQLLFLACEGHTHERTHPDVTIQTCWDADRLDLGRVGITPQPSRLCTEVAKRPEIINWADGRAQFGVLPAFVLKEWKIKLRSE
jgi:uncharacterized protein